MQRFLITCFLGVCIVLLGKNWCMDTMRYLKQYDWNTWKDIDNINEKVIILKQKHNQNASTKEELTLYARSAALMDASSGRVLFSKDGDKEMAMASTTKIMTCMIILEHAKMDDIVMFSSNAAKQPDVQLNGLEGEQYYVKDLLYALMLESYNDVAVALAEHVGGSVEGFANMMNQKATELDCKHTHFVTPNGLDADTHYATAEELCKIAAYAIKNEEFLKITNTTSYTFSEIKNGRTFTVSNKDQFLNLYEGAIGVKTGFTNDAGYCFVGAVDKGNKVMISAVLGCGWPPNKTYKWSDTIKLMDYGNKYFSTKTFFDKKISLPGIAVYGGKKQYVKLKYKQSTYSMLSDGSEKEKILLEIPEVLIAPVDKRTPIGTIYYYIDDEIVNTEEVYPVNSVNAIDFSFLVDTLKKIWCI